jgi:predicted metal-dependent enzyme (double-stranded beta helix superfamily)
MQQDVAPELGGIVNLVRRFSGAAAAAGTPEYFRVDCLADGGSEQGTGTMFDTGKFIEDCRGAVAENDSHKAVRELVARAVSNPTGLEKVLGEPEHAGIDVLYRGPDLTIINFTWAPWMSLLPHNHNMWAVIGIFSGREDNVFWRRTESGIEAAGADSMGVGDVIPLGRDIIHSVLNPIGKMTRAIHVYGGDFFEPPTPRSQWDHETLQEQPWDMDNTRRTFAEAEARAKSVR